jgi:GNAT superfamily N-acetyltransferase
VAFDRLVLLELQEGKWGPLADVALGPLSRVGTGGFVLELARSRMLDPEGRALIDELGNPVAAHRAVPGGPLRRSPVVITARCAGSVCGVAGAWLDDAGGHVGLYVRVGERRRGVGRHLLAAAESAVAAAQWQCGLLRASGPAQFYVAVSSYSKVTEV